MPVNSALIPLGTSAPDFSLPDLTGIKRTLASFDEHDVLVVMFSCNHCPYVQHIETKLAEVAQSLPAVIVAICSNDANTHPDDSPAGLAEQATRAAGSFLTSLTPTRLSPRRTEQCAHRTSSSTARTVDLHIEVPSTNRRQATDIRSMVRS